MRRILLAADTCVLLIFIAAAFMSAEKAGLGVKWTAHSPDDPRPKVTQVNSGISPGVFMTEDVIVSINLIELHSVEDVEQVVDGLIIDGVYPVRVLRNGKEEILSIRAGRYYEIGYLALQWGTTFLFFMLGVYVGYKRPKERSAILFNALGLTIGGIVMFTASRYTLLPFYAGHAIRGMFPASFLFSAVLMAHFGLEFPRRRSVPAWVLQSTYAGVALVAAAGFIASVVATVNMDLETARIYYLVESLGKFALMIGSVFAIGMFQYSHYQTKEIADRIQLKWVLFGTSVCIFIYIFLWSIPNSILVRYSLPDHWKHIVETLRVDEEWLILSVLFAASCMTVALLRFKAFDIDVIIRRSTLYGIVFGLLILVYVFVLAWTWERIDPRQNIGDLPEVEYLRYIAAIVFMTLNLLLFLPARGLVQRVLDKFFYRVRYNYREAIRRFSDEIRGCLTTNAVGDKMIETTAAFFNPLKLAFMLVENDRNLRVLSHRNFDALARRPLHIQLHEIIFNLEKPIAQSGKVEAGAECDISEAGFFLRWDVALVIPMHSDRGALLGFFALGEKKSRYKYSIEDIDLLRLVTRQAAMEIDRILLQQELWTEQREAERLEELNEMKSYFVSSVSHDLKTPLTSIRIFSELLHGQTTQHNAEAEKYLNIIEGECERLTRLINNVLDFAKIEKGMKQYNFAPVDFNSVVQKVVEITEYQLSMSGFTLETSYGKVSGELWLDEDAVIQAITNLVTNSIKYSSETKWISIATDSTESAASVTVSDRGIGIDGENLERIFEPYVRAAGPRAANRTGTGLGLALVKHTVDAHCGRLDISSEREIGTTITLHFPLKVRHEANISH